MKKIRLCAIALLLALLTGGCGKSLQASEMPLPEGFSLPEMPLYGLGEATHGSAEFTFARQNVFEYLVRERGVRAFCLEADFGEGLKINSQLHGEGWNAKNTTKQFAFWVYSHQEMAALMQWMRDYNGTAEEKDQIQFYGFDCQQLDDSKAWLLAYLRRVAAESAKALEQSPLHALSDRNLQNTDGGTIADCIVYIEELFQTMQMSREAYAAASSEREYDLALQAAASMRQCLLLQQAGMDMKNLFSADLSEEESAVLTEQSIAYSNMRDMYMAERVSWILQHEEKYYGRKAIFLTGHNGHIMRDNVSPGLPAWVSALRNSIRVRIMPSGRTLAEGGSAPLSRINKEIKHSSWIGNGLLRSIFQIWRGL